MTYWIRFPSDKEYEKAVGAWWDINTERVGFPDRQTFVSEEHIQALKRAKVKFEFLYKPEESRRNGKKTARRKSRSR